MLSLKLTFYVGWNTTIPNSKLKRTAEISMYYNINISPNIFAVYISRDKK